MWTKEKNGDCGSFHLKEKRQNGDAISRPLKITLGMAPLTQFPGTREILYYDTRRWRPQPYSTGQSDVV